MVLHRSSSACCVSVGMISVIVVADLLHLLILFSAAAFHCVDLCALLTDLDVHISDSDSTDVSHCHSHC